MAKVLKSNKMKQPKKASKLGQIESIGLMIIVILIVLALVFTIPFLINNPDIQSLNQEYLQFKADSTISTLLATNINECEAKITIKQELENCLLDNTPKCFPSCQELNNQLQSLLDYSLPTQDYQFLIDSKPIIQKAKAAQQECSSKLFSATHFIAGNNKLAIAVCTY